MKSDLAGGETLPSAVCHKSYPNMEQIEKRIEELQKMVSEHIFKTTGKLVPVGSGKLCFRLKITVFRTEYCFRRALGNSRSKR